MHIQIRNRGQRPALATEIVFDTAQYKGTSQRLLALLQLSRREPVCTQNPAVQRLVRLMIIHGSAEGKTHCRDAAFGTSPQINTHQGCGLETPSCLLSDFANNGSK